MILCPLYCITQHLPKPVPLSPVYRVYTQGWLHPIDLLQSTLFLKYILYQWLPPPIWTYSTTKALPWGPSPFLGNGWQFDKGYDTKMLKFSSHGDLSVSLYHCFPQVDEDISVLTDPCSYLCFIYNCCILFHCLCVLLAFNCFYTMYF